MRRRCPGWRCIAVERTACAAAALLSGGAGLQDGAVQLGRLAYWLQPVQSCEVADLDGMPGIK